MASVNGMTEIAGLVKQVYPKGIVTAYAFAAPLSAKYITFDYQQAGLGDKYNQPVDIQLESSFTSAAAGSTPTYLAIKTGAMVNATAEGAQLFGRSSVTYEALDRAKSAGPKAFESAAKRVTKRLSMSHLKRLEMQLICGRRGIAVGEAISGTSTTRALVVNAETWSAGRFAGATGATLAMLRADRTTAVAPSTGAAGSFYISSVDVATRTINITANSTDATAMDTYWIASGGGVLFWESNGTITEFGTTTEIAGLDAWCNMSGTWFNIATSSYDLWNPNVYSTSTGVISFAKIVEAAEMMFPYGSVKKVVALCSAKAFSTLNTDLAALRQYDSSYKTSKGELGVEGIEFKCSIGTIEILPHALQSDGMIHLFCPDEVLRTGIHFITRGSNGENIILESATTPAGEMRTMSNQQLFVEQPRHLVLMSGITFG
jgi:hypothetical protein